MIEPMQPDDASAVAALDADLFPGHAWSARAWEQEAAGEADRRYLVLREAPGDAPSGYAGILRAGSDADVLTVAVAPALRRRGHGRELVQALLGIAQGWRTREVFLEVAEDNSAARELYRSLGFEEIGVRRHYYGSGRHGITMRRRLREPMGSIPLGGQD